MERIKQEGRVLFNMIEFPNLSSKERANMLSLSKRRVESIINKIFSSSVTHPHKFVKITNNQNDN